ncbi:MAG TPA: hypothetical protein VMF67_14130, partial [Rhizomicrobium sp.]|nr:hypothetical protein [Rhizomicrobium sp.]
GAIDVAVSGITSPANWLVDGDTVWISNVESPQGANGRWTVANVASPISGTGVFTLVGSVYAGPTINANVTLTQNSNILTVASGTSLAGIYGQQVIGSQLWPGQYICASGSPPNCNTPQGIPSGTTVVSVWPAKNEIVMSHPASANENLSMVEFLNSTTTALAGACSGSIGSCASAYASQRYWTYNQDTQLWSSTPSIPNCTLPTPGPHLVPGTCPATAFLIGGQNQANDNNNGINLTTTFTYAHEIQYHIWNSNSTALFNTGSDNHNELNDPNVVGYWFDGSTDRSKVDLRESHSNFIDILQSSSTSDCNAVVGGEIGIDVANAHAIENDKGCLLLSHTNASGYGLALISAASTQTDFSLDYLPNILPFFESSAASQTTFGDGTSVFYSPLANDPLFPSLAGLAGSPNFANFGSCPPATSQSVIAQFCGGNTFGTYGNTILHCNPAFQPTADTTGCMSWQLLSTGRYVLGNAGPTTPSGTHVFEYEPTWNSLMEPDQDGITSVAQSSVSDLTANINVVETNGGANTGVQLPLAANAVDLTSNRGAGACKQILNTTSSAIQVWAHTPDYIMYLGVSNSGATGVSLPAYTRATFCPTFPGVMVGGWVGDGAGASSEASRTRHHMRGLHDRSGRAPASKS